MPATPIDLDGCRETLGEALTLTRSLPDSFHRAFCFLTLAREFNKIGDFARGAESWDQTLATAQALLNKFTKEIVSVDNIRVQKDLERQKSNKINATLRYIGIVQAENKDIDAAIHTANQIQDAGTKINLLLDIANAQSKIGYIAGEIATLTRAFEVSRDGGRDGGTVMTLDQLATIHTKAGDTASALQMVDLMPISESKAIALRNIVNLKAEDGNISEAIHISALIQDQLTKVFTLNDIATVQCNRSADCHETLSQALQTAYNIEHPISKTEALIAIAKVQNQIGDQANCKATLDEARRVADQIQYAEDKADLLTAIAELQAEVSATAQAHDTLIYAIQAAQAIEKEDHRAATLADIAKAQVRAGEHLKSHDTLVQLFQFADSIQDKEKKSVSFVSLVEAQVQIGDILGAYQTVQAIPDTFRKVYALILIAQAQALAGDMEDSRATLTQARRIVDDVTFIPEKINGLIRIAKAQAGQEHW